MGRCALVLADVGIRGTWLTVPPEDAPDVRRLLGDGSQFGVNASCAVQEVPNGLAQAFLVGEEFTGGGSVALVLGDNLFYGPGVGRGCLDSLTSMVPQCSPTGLPTSRSAGSWSLATTSTPCLWERNPMSRSPLRGCGPLFLRRLDG
mgnify:FL=1